jgi:hypothetical protein
MPEKLSLRLSAKLSHDVQHEARRRGVSASAMICIALQQVLGQSTPTSAPSPLPPAGPWERWLTTCPPEVEVAVRQAVAGTGLPLEGVLKALIITACQPRMIPQSSPNTEVLPMATLPALGLAQGRFPADAGGDVEPHRDARMEYPPSHPHHCGCMSPVPWA